MKKSSVIVVIQAVVIAGLLSFIFLKNKLEVSLSNPAVYFEIPVLDMNRATKFYSSVFGFDFSRENIHGNEMAFFPLDTKAQGITGGLAKGEIYKPSKEGTLVYFFSSDIDLTITKVLAAGGKVLFPKTQAGEYGFVSEFEDSEGNRIGLSQK
jgi:predicted enzyme related to lactoylglutathione lyase